MKKWQEDKLQDSVERGAKLLDEYMPDWPTRIDPEHLELCDPHACVLGQTFTHLMSDTEGVSPYTVGLAALGIDGPDDRDSYFGFESPGFRDCEVGEEYSVLTELWLIEAKARLDAGLLL